MRLEHVCEHIDRLEWTFLMGDIMKEEMLEQRLKWIVSKLCEDIKDFIEEHPELKFYSVGLDCNSEYGTMMLCFNTQEEFDKEL